MIINYLGDSSFTIKGSGATVAISGKVVPDSDILISTNSPNPPNTPQSSSPQPFLITTPGEYEVKGVHIYGHSLTKDAVAYLIKIDGFTVCFLPQTKKVLDDDLTSELSEADILLFDFSQKGGINVEVATEVVSQIEPKIIIPTNGENVIEFVKQMGKENNKEMDKLTIKTPSDLPKETEIFILKH